VKKEVNVFKKMLKNNGFKLEQGLLSFEVKHSLARSFTTSTETLDRLANDNEWYVRRWVARNPNTPPETLERLANDDDFYVRREVARNPNTPQYIKTYLKIKNYLSSTATVS
jgi:3-methyladenine DNA glycosylase AlkC